MLLICAVVSQGLIVGPHFCNILINYFAMFSDRFNFILCVYDTTDESFAEIAAKQYHTLPHYRFILLFFDGTVLTGKILRCVPLNIQFYLSIYHHTSQPHHTPPHNTTQYHTIPHNTTQYHTIPHNTTQHHTSHTTLHHPYMNDIS